MLDDIRELLKDKPGLKGRQIAKNIGEERKAVNSFLSKNLDIFEKDDETIIDEKSLILFNSTRLRL